MTSKLTGFSPRSARRVAGVWTVFVLASAGWALGGQLGAVMAVVVGVGRTNRYAEGGHGR